MIKTVHIITNLVAGGAEMQLYKLLAGMDKTHFESMVISMVEKGIYGRWIEALGIPVHILEMSEGKPSLSALWTLSRLIRSFQPDIIQGWMYHANIAATISRLLYFKKVPMLWNIRHSLYDISYEKRLTRQIIRIGAITSKIPEKIIYNSRKGADQHEAFGYKVDRTIVIPNGIDCAQFKPSPMARERLHNKLNIGENDILIGLIGRYHLMKDHQNFFKAAGELIKKYDNVHFVLAGLGIDDRNAVLSELILQNQVRNKVHMLGELKDTSELTAGLDIACSSSYGEGFPNVIGEAMACGVPSVVTDVGDSALIVGPTGKVIPPRDSKALAAAWESLIESGQQERMRLGGEARQRVLKKYSLVQNVHLYEALYEGIIKESMSKGY